MPLVKCDVVADGDNNHYACNIPTPGDPNQANCLNNFTISGGRQIVLRPEQLSNLGLSGALTLGAAATVPVGSSCDAAATVTSCLQFSTVSV